MKVLVAPDKFKGSLTAVAAVEAIINGWHAVFPEDEMQPVPIADGGEGFAEALSMALGGEWILTRARDPLGREVDARYAWVEKDRLAIIDMSEASGLWRLRDEERDPLRATTCGTGQLLRHAAERGARTILVGLGGSATTDGGIGLAAALGYETLTSDGDELEPVPGNLNALTRIVHENVADLPEIIAACDVQNPLLGPRGAARVFSPQKGADAETVEALELGLETLADVVAQELGCEFRDAPGAGAAGGLGFGLMSFCQAKMRSGFDLLAEALRIEQKIAECDLVITGEGRLDRQTLEGKGPASLAKMARRQGKPILAFAGSIAEDGAVSALFDATCVIVDEPVTLQTAMDRGAEFLERATRRVARLVQLGRHL
ncbi:MAG: glycerate kinase [Verrucomicrobiota bacterium]|nr:glycerate kinase [Verrucomicrobiota bacterium]